MRRAAAVLAIAVVGAAGCGGSDTASYKHEWRDDPAMKGARPAVLEVMDRLCNGGGAAEYWTEAERERYRAESCVSE